MPGAPEVIPGPLSLLHWRGQVRLTLGGCGGFLDGRDLQALSRAAQAAHAINVHFGEATEVRGWPMETPPSSSSLTLQVSEDDEDPDPDPPCRLAVDRAALQGQLQVALAHLEGDRGGHP